MAISVPAMRRRIGFNILGAAIALGGLAIAYAGAVDASVNAGHPDGPFGIARGSGAALHEHLAADLALDKGASISSADRGLATALLLEAPLDANALTYLGFAATADAPRARALMELALRSDGRAARPRLWLIDYAIAHRDYSAAVAHLDRLITTNPQLAQSATVAMTAIVRDPASRAPLAQMLSTNPAWRVNFLDQLNQQGLSSDAIFGLTARDSAQEAAISEQSSLLLSLVKNHEYERAYLAWINFLPQAQLKQVGTIYDPQFVKIPGPLPFNWQLNSGADGSAEFSPPHGLTVAYLGAVQTTMAMQTLLLSPGHYMLSIVASGNDTYNQLNWTLTCTDSNSQVADMQLTGLKDAAQRYRTAFQVPASGCGAQRLALTGSPGEFPRTANAAILALQIEAVR